VSNTVPPTVADTKRNFYQQYTRPINSIYRRVVEELMVEMHLLSVYADFRYDPIYALGIVTAFERFMLGYHPEADKKAIFQAVISAVGGDPQKYQQDAEKILTAVKDLSLPDLISWVSDPNNSSMQAIATNSKFKYSRLFAIGLYTLLETAIADIIKDDKQRNEGLKQIASALNISTDKLLKDLDLYRSNLEKLAQARIALADAMEAERKKREKRAQEQAAKI
jgi:photosystem II biogenesis protein Psp29